MVKVWPPAVTTPARGLVSAFWEIVTETAPLPGPPPLTTAIQLDVLAAVHAQPAPVVTLKLALPPAAGTLAEVGDTL